MSFKPPIFLQKIKHFLDGIQLPILGISAYKMFKIYGEGLFALNIGRMAAAISWSFFLSLFPLILFSLSVLPYLPHYEELQHYIFDVLIPNIVPEHIQPDIIDYIQNFLIPNIENISILTIVLAIFFATNGTYSLINGFNHNVETQRGMIWEYFVSFLVTLAFVVTIFISLLGIYYGEIVVKLFSPPEEISWFVDNLAKIIGFISFPTFYFILLSMLYWVGCTKTIRWKHSAPGAILTTILFILLTYFFAIYVRDFAKYNILYGSIGTIILVMIWVNINIILILLGNELNIAIRRVRNKK